MPNEAAIETVKTRLEDHEKRIAELERLMQMKPEFSKSKLSVKDFVRSKKPKDDLQRTVAIGYYMEKYEDLMSFTAKDLENGFRKAKEFIPKNINDKVNKNIEKKYMMPAEEKKGNKKAWVLTASGEQYVEGGFQEDQ